MGSYSWKKRFENFGKKIIGTEESKKIETTPKLTKLQEICSGSPEIYDMLEPVIFLDPRKIKESTDQIEKRASESEKNKDFIGASMWYEVLGGLSIYHGDVSKVRKHYTKAQEMALEASKSPDMYPAYKTPKVYAILKNPEGAVKKAQEFYKKTEIIS